MEYNHPMNFRPTHRQIHPHPSQNPQIQQPLYSTHDEPLHSSYFINHHHHPHPYLLHAGNPTYEQKLIDEVIYLHSLWHRGPPQINLSIPSSNPLLKPSSSTPFKKKKKKKKPNKTLQSQLISDKEWPVDDKPTCSSPPGSTWAQFRARSNPNIRPATAEEKARVLAMKIQLKGLDSCMGLFGGSSDDDDDDEDDDCDEEFEYLWKVFEGDDQLRGYYEKNYEEGEFYCLVCGVVGKKFGRKYKNCVALVQHAVSVSKTKKKAAHRAYGYAVCKLLRWKINQLPSLPASNADGSAQSMVVSCEVQGEKNSNVDGSKEDSSQISLQGDGLCTRVEHGQSEQDATCVSNPIDRGVNEV